MYYCKKCNKSFKKKKELYDGLCENCYKKIILEEINHLDFKESSSHFYSFLDFFKKIFKK